MTFTPKHLKTLKKLLSHPSDNFVELARIAGLRLDKDFRHANLRGVDFGTADTSGWDFTDSDLSYADLSHTHGAPPKTAGARIEGTKLPVRGLGHVFISYAYQNRDDIDRLATSLQSRGVTVWLDRRDIAPGSRWRDAIRAAIRSSHFFIACFSKESNQREKTYMNEELTLAIDELRARPSDDIWFIPVLLNDTEIPSRAITITETLNDIHAIKLYEGWDEGVEQIMRVVAPFAESVPALVAALNDPDAHVRRSAVDALGSIGQAASEAVPALITALNDRDTHVRRSAAGALAKIQGERIA